MHFIVQETFCWLNSHLFDFSDVKIIQTISVGVPDDNEMERIGPEKKMHTKLNLKKLSRSTHLASKIDGRIDK